MSNIDLWSEPYVPTPKVKEELKPELEPKKRGRPKKDKPKDLSNLYVITAGINKATERRLFVATSEDCDDWSISVVPTVMNKARASKLMEKAQQYINDNPKRYRYKPSTLALESIENPEIYKLVKCLIRSEEQLIINLLISYNIIIQEGFI